MRLGLGLGLDIGYRSELFGGTSYLLDTYTGAAAAYSLRQLRTDVTNVVRVRRSSDNEELDITAAEVSDGTLTTWVGVGNNGFVTTWYDQSGNGYNATQSTAGWQPKLVSSGNLITENGLPAISWDDTNDSLATSEFLSELTQPNSIISVHKANNISDEAIHDGIFVSKRNYLVGNNITYQMSAGTLLQVGINSGSQSLAYAYYNGSSSGLAINGGSLSTVNIGTQGLTGLTIGANFNSTNVLSGNIQEIILFNSDQSSNRTGIEANINDYYSIY